MLNEEIERLGVGSPEFKRKYQELDDMIEKARSYFFSNEPDDDLTFEEQDNPSEKKSPEKIDDIQLLDDLGEIRNLLEKASNSLDSFQYRYKLMFSLDDDAETKGLFFKQRTDTELGLSIISNHITTVHKKLHLIEKEKTAK